MVTARNAAYYIIRFCHEHGDAISNLKLQKLLYYAQAWHLALYNRPLFGDRIEAWVHGPVVPSVYVEFKQWSWQPISVEITECPLSGEVKAHMDDVMEAYGGLTAVQLERLTHSEDPWRIARGSLAPDAASHNEIRHEDMRSYYKKRLSDAAENQAG